MQRSRQLPVALAMGLFAVQIGAFLAPADAAGVALLSDVTPFLIPIATAAACLVVARQRGNDGWLVWLFLGLGSLAWGLGDVGFSIYDMVGFDPAARLTMADAGYLALIPLWMAALVMHPSRSRRGIDRLGTTVDGLTLFAAIGTFTVAYVLAPMLADALDLSGAVVNLAYPVADLMLLAVLVSIQARTAQALRPADVLVAGAAAVFALGDIVYARLVTVDAYYVGHPVDLTWSAAFVLVALAAGRTLASKNAVSDEMKAAVPLLAIFGIGGFAALGAAAAVTRFQNRYILTGAVATGLLLVARLVILLFDRARLIRSFDGKVHELEDATAARERFIATVSHDLRSPLASISGFAELLREPEVLKDSKQVAEMTSAIERNARRLARLTEDLLCAGQFATGHPPPLKLAAVDLRQIAQEAIGDMGSSERVTVTGSRWIYAMADKQRVQQILVNLVENAFKHSGSKEVQIAVSSNADGAAIEVSDHGKGIPGERIAQIFDPFVSDFRNSSSTGLGLFVVRNLVAAMNGRISVTSEVDVGTSFHITLPAAVPESVFNEAEVHATSD